MTELVGEALESRKTMTYKRSSHSMCAINDNLILVSGSTHLGDYAASKRCEVYDIEKDSWEELHQMNYPRCQHGSCTSGNLVSIFFGKNPYDKEVIYNSIETFDTSTGDFWSVFTPETDVLTPRYWCGIACLGEAGILIFGGYGSDKQLSDAYIFQPATKELTSLSSNTEQFIYSVRMPTWVDNDIILTGNENDNKIYAMSVESPTW